MKLLVGAYIFLSLISGSAAEPGNETDSAKFVRPIAPAKFHLAPKTSESEKLVRDYHALILRWDDILLEKIKAIPGKPGCAYYAEDGHEENQIRPLCYATLINAFLAENESDSASTPSSRRNQAREDAFQTLRYLTQGHVTGSGACVNGKQWGNHWQSAMWARSAGFAGWILWPKLPADLKSSVAKMVEFEADRFLKSKPKSSVANDTGAEENAWNAQILSLACNMMPQHPHAKEWDHAAKRWMYNTFSVEADQKDSRTGDDNIPVNRWVETVNAHPDFTVENHGIVHVGYLKTSLALLLENALPYFLTDKPVPQAVQHNLAESFNVFLHCMAWDGAPLYFSGNDWKIVHTQGNDVMTFGLMSLLTGDRSAAYVEQLSLGYVAKLQKANGGFFNERRDLESGGMSATRMMAALWLHAMIGKNVSPVSKAEFEKKVSGVTLFEHGKAILHRTPTKFVSFSWGQKRMALALPENGLWTVWPHFSSGLGKINGVDASEKSAKLVELQRDLRDDGFTVNAIFERFNGAVTQSVSFTSLPGDVAVYIERIQAQKDFKLDSRETGIVGLEYDLDSNERELFSRSGKMKAIGAAGDKLEVHLIQTDWLNIADRVGHVMKRFPEHANVVRYHDEPMPKGPIPVLQEWLSLVGENSVTEISRDGDWACVVTFLNQKSAETERAVKQVEFAVNGDTATCRIDKTEVQADFSGPHRHRSQGSEK